jgi:tripartite-type tricarboxylate transporter receptor subunit TctC
MRPSKLIAAIAAGLLPTGAAQAQQNYPARPLRIIVPSSAASSPDSVARVMSQPLSERLGQQVVVDNRAGAGTLIGTELVAKAAPDGYTLLMAPAALTINPSLYKKLPYDTLRDFAPITLAASSFSVLVVHPALPVKSVKELISLARERAGELVFASSGVGSTTHLQMELFLLLTGTRMLHVPHKGPAPAMIDLIAGRAVVMTAGATAAMSHLRSGRLRGLGVTTAQRTTTLPDLPSIAEAGVTGYESTGWSGLLAPAATAREIIARLHTESIAVLRSDNVKARLAVEGTEVVASTPEEFASFLRAEIVKWGKVVKGAGISAE